MIKGEKDWKNVALRTVVYEALEVEARRQHRSVTNCLEVILCDVLKVKLTEVAKY
jgi:hypothetical protein